MNSFHFLTTTMVFQHASDIRLRSSFSSWYVFVCYLHLEFSLIIKPLTGSMYRVFWKLFLLENHDHFYPHVKKHDQTRLRLNFQWNHYLTYTKHNIWVHLDTNILRVDKKISTVFSNRTKNLFNRNSTELWLKVTYL